jgi:hypothetical protein
MTSQMKGIALACLVAAVLVAACTPTSVIKDRLDTFVLVGFDRPATELSTCVVAANEDRAIIERSNNCGDRAWRIQPGGSVPIWAWSVSSRDLTRPQPGKSITFMVVDRDGARVPETHAGVSPGVAVTGDDGFTHTRLTVWAARPGVYRVRATYADRSADGYAYSPNLIVQTH